MYAGCLVLRISKLQTQITLITAEAEYTALSQAVRDVLTFMIFLREVLFIFNIHLPKPKLF